MPRRKKPIARTGRVKPVNAKRKRKNFQRAYGGKARRAWTVAQPCVACHREPPVDPAHIKTGGTSYKADACYVIPLCHPCHCILHDHGPRSFEARYGLSLATQAQLTEMAWQRYQLEEAA